MGQAVANIVDNAIKYGKRTETDPALAAPGAMISVSTRRVGANAEIIVADNGPGIAPEDRGRVIDRFVRLESSRSQMGSGLGLSLAAAVARLHGGEMRLEDNGPGLKVIISFPARPSAETS